MRAPQYIQNFVAGFFYTDAQGGGNDRNYLIIKFDSNGYKVWDKAYSAVSVEELNGITLGDDGYLYASGDSEDG